MGEELATQDELHDDEQQPQEVETEQTELDTEEELGTVVLEGEEEPKEDDSPPPPRTRLVRDLRKTIKDKNKALKAGNRERDSLSEENAALKARLAQYEAGGAPAQQQSAPAQPGARPKLADFNYDPDQYEQAVEQWMEQQIDTRIESSFQQREQSQQSQSRQNEAHERIDAHYSRAQQLAVPDFSDAEMTVAESLGVELVQSIQATLDNSEEVIYYLGKNPAKLDELRREFDVSPARGTVKLGVLSAKTRFQPTGKTLPDPDLGVPGGGGGESTPQYRKFARRLKEATDKGGVDVIAKRRKIKQEAAAAGVDLTGL